MADVLNEDIQNLEKRKKDERKMRRENGLSQSQNCLKCTEVGCCFVGQTKAGLGEPCEAGS